MEILKEGAVYRGFDTEVFYCPMGPDEKIDHLIIPQLSLAFVTANEYHDIEPWELFDEEDWSDLQADMHTDITEKEITLIDINDYMKLHVLEENELLTAALREEYDILLGRTIKALGQARDAHMKVENMYIPNMNFTGLSALAREFYEELAGI